MGNIFVFRVQLHTPLACLSARLNFSPNFTITRHILDVFSGVCSVTTIRISFPTQKGSYARFLFPYKEIKKNCTMLYHLCLPFLWLLQQSLLLEREWPLFEVSSSNFKSVISLPLTTTIVPPPTPVLAHPFFFFPVYSPIIYSIRWLQQFKRNANHTSLISWDPRTLRS